MDWFKQKIADTASYVKNKVTQAAPGMAPVLSSAPINNAAVKMGGVRDKKGYTCTGSKMRKCKKSRRTRRRV
jgi:hypothetical protein